MNIEALQTLVDSVSGLWVQFEQSTTFTLVVIIVVSVVLIYNLSENVSSLEVRVLFILLSVAIAYAVGTNASVIFITLNLDQIYRDFFLNLSADMFVALFIPLVYVTWFQHRNLWRVFFTAFVICALFWLAVVYLPPLMADEFKLSRAFLNNLKLEIVAGFVTAVLGICILHIARVVRAMTKYERTSDEPHLSGLCRAAAALHLPSPRDVSHAEPDGCWHNHYNRAANPLDNERQIPLSDCGFRAHRGIKYSASRHCEL
jgi:hypothetical protein